MARELRDGREMYFVRQRPRWSLSGGTRALLGVLAFSACWHAGVSEACGNWQLEDLEKSRTVIFGAMRVAISAGAEAQKHPAIFHIYDQGRAAGMFALLATADWQWADPPFDQANKRAELRWSQSNLQYRGKTVGTLAPEGFVLDGKTYAFSWEFKGAGRYSKRSWALTVTRADRPVLKGLAEQLPCGRTSGREEGRELLRRRVATYLAWRELIEGAD